MVCCGSAKSAEIDETAGDRSKLVSGKSRRSIRQIFSSLKSRLFGQKEEAKSRKRKIYEDDENQIANHSLACKGVTGTGTFGIVYKACPIENPKEILAVKRIELDEESETREVDLHKMAKHPNIVALKEHWMKNVFQNQRLKKRQIYMVMEFLPQNLEDHIHEYACDFKTMPAMTIKVYTFQMFRALNYLHVINILHRDIKPSNCLIDTKTGVLKLCDFGCAKKAKKDGSKNRTYICSRYYRAPELVLNNTHNDENIDVWAAGCVLAECFRGWPLFPGKSSRHQFGAIADVLGNPSQRDLYYLNPSLKQLNCKIRDSAGSFDEHFPPKTPELVMDLLSRMFPYPPKNRLSLLSVMADPYYDQLRLNTKTMLLPSGLPLPPIFKFTPAELGQASPELVKRLLPKSEQTAELCILKPRPKPPPAPPPPPSQSRKRRPTVNSVDSTTETKDEADEVFSELDSNDVDEIDMWDCKKICILDDDVVPTMM